MSTKLLRKSIPMEVIFPEPVFILRNVGISFDYEDGVRTDRKLGTWYDVVDTTDFDQIRVKVPGKLTPIIDEVELRERREAGEKFFVEFTAGKDVPYLKKTGSSFSIEDSFSAEDVSFVEDVSLM